MEPPCDESRMARQRERISAEYGWMPAELARGNEITLGFEAGTALPSINKIFAKLSESDAFAGLEVGYRYAYFRENKLFFCLKLGKKEDWERIWERKLFGHEIMDFEAGEYGFEEKEMALLKRKYALMAKAVVDILSSFGITSISGRKELEGAWKLILPLISHNFAKRAGPDCKGQPTAALAWGMKHDTLEYYASSVHFCADVLSSLGARCALVVLSRPAILRAVAKDGEEAYIDPSEKRICHDKEEVRKSYGPVFSIENYSENELPYSYLYMIQEGFFSQKSMKREAAQALEASIRLNGRNARTHWLRGMDFGIKGDYGAAAGCFRRAAELEQLYCEAHYWLGRTLLLAGKPQEAMESLEKAAHAGPEHVEVFETLEEAAEAVRAAQNAQSIPLPEERGQKTAQERKYYIPQNGE